MTSLMLTKINFALSNLNPICNGQRINIFTQYEVVWRFRGYFVSFQSCYYEDTPYPVGDFVPQENCTMLCFCSGYGPPSPCVPMCQRLPVPTCEIGKKLYSYDEENQYGCLCKMTVCR